MGLHFYFVCNKFGSQLQDKDKMWVLRHHHLRTTALDVWREVVRHLCQISCDVVNGKAKVFHGSLIKLSTCINLLMSVDFFCLFFITLMLRCIVYVDETSTAYPIHIHIMRPGLIYTTPLANFLNPSFTLRLKLLPALRGKPPVCFRERLKPCDRLCSLYHK